MKESADREWYANRRLKFEIDNKFLYYSYLGLMMIPLLLALLGGLYLFIMLFLNFGKILKVILDSVEMPFGISNDYKILFVSFILISLILYFKLLTKK